MLFIICSSKGKATFANKDDTHHLNNQHQCVADDKDFLTEVHNKKSDVNAENMTTALDDRAPENSTGAPEQMSSTRGMFPLGPVPERLFN